MNSDSITDITLHQIVNQIKLNFKDVNERFPKIYQAAEMINNIYQQIFKEELKPSINSKWLQASHLLVFGSYQSWLKSYIMVCAGFPDIGLMAARRAIEFVCYLSKIKKSDKRAEIWMSKWNDKELKRKFSSKFSVPGKYFTPKYKHLRGLLVLHDYASSFAVHGNYGTLIDKFKKGENSNEVIFSLQSLRKDIYLPIGNILDAGYLMLQSIDKVLSDYIEKSGGFSSCFQELPGMIRQVKLKIAEIEFSGNVPRDILDTIINDDISRFDEPFQKLKEKYQNK